MDLTGVKGEEPEVVMVKRHPSGCLHGQIMKESEAF